MDLSTYPEVMTLNEVCGLLRFDHETIKKHERSGQPLFPRLLYTNKRLYLKKEILKYLKSLETNQSLQDREE